MKPLCVAARTALLIDTDKSLRPCCSYTDWGRHVADSHGIARLSPDQTIRATIASAPWQEIVRQLDAGQIPEGCRICMQRERDTGMSMRKVFDVPGWKKGLTYLEINSSNLCTLQCRHCGPLFSHRWAKVTGSLVSKPDSDLLRSCLRELDCSHLRQVSFKGGEPLMNSDLSAALAHFDEIGILSKLQVQITSNGTVVNRPVMALLGKAAQVHFTLSVDGVGDVQTYIRHGKSDVANIERFIAACTETCRKPSGREANVSFWALTSIMVYNIFSLPDIASWWSGLAARLHARTMPITFHHFVVDPSWLSLQSLRDATRERLIAFYQARDKDLYANVLRTLRLPYAGDEQHARFVDETLRTDKLLGRDVLDAVPELAAEIKDRN